MHDLKSLVVYNHKVAYYYRPKPRGEHSHMEVTGMCGHDSQSQWRSNRPDRSDNVRPIIRQKKKKKKNETEKKKETKNHEKPTGKEETF